MIPYVMTCDRQRCCISENITCVLMSHRVSKLTFVRECQAGHSKFGQAIPHMQNICSFLASPKVIRPPIFMATKNKHHTNKTHLQKYKKVPLGGDAPHREPQSHPVQQLPLPGLWLGWQSPFLLGVCSVGKTSNSQRP